MKNTIKKFIESKYYDCEEVHNLNNYLNSLPNSYVNKDFAQNIYNLTTINKPYENIEDYVVGSKKHLELISNLALYKESTLELSNMNFKKEKIIEEVYPDYMDLYRFSFDISSLEYNEETEQDEEVIKEHFFYVEQWTKEIVFCPSKLKISYIRDGEDLIKNMIDSYNYLNKEKHSINMCKKTDIDYNLFSKVFDIKKVLFYGNGMINFSYIKYENKEYSIHDIKTLIQLYTKALSLRYIKDDTYIKYPNVLFIDFKDTEMYINALVESI